MERLRPAAVKVTKNRGGCDPCQGREHPRRFTGGVVASLLNRRLMARDPSGMGIKIRPKSPRGNFFWQSLNKRGGWGHLLCDAKLKSTLLIGFQAVFSGLETLCDKV